VNGTFSPLIWRRSIVSRGIAANIRIPIRIASPASTVSTASGSTLSTTGELSLKIQRLTAPRFGVLRALWLLGGSMKAKSIVILALLMGMMPITLS
jgi:hypothetical protein